MEILAIYIDNHFLYPNSVYLNFGGKYLFSFSKEESQIHVSKHTNEQKTTNFYNSSITNISAIVGNNGVGKTSLMRILNQEPKSNALSIYLNDEKIFIQNTLESSLDCDFDFESINSDDCPFPLYYSNIIDYNLQDFNSPISESNLIRDSLSEYYYDSILRQVFFLYNKGETLTEKYPELPFYSDVSISVNNVSKSQFLNNDFYQKATIGKSISEQLNMLWASYGYESESTIHNNEDFLKNFEVFILSLLVTDDTFAQTNNNRFSIGFDEILQEDNFRNKLEIFLKKRLDNIDGPLFEGLEERLGVSFDNLEDLIQKIREDKLIQIGGGFDFTMIKNHAIQTILRYYRIFRLYDFVEENYQLLKNSSDVTNITLKVENQETEQILRKLFKLYQEVYETLQYLTFEYRVFNVSPTRKMSTGELSILNLFSSIYKFTLRKESAFQKKNSYLLLFDEPDHGLHAVWKKKFIATLNKILPKIFSELEHNPKIQIIFTTHDALTLSDLPNNNISYLKRITEDTIKVFDLNDHQRPNKSFGANITDLLADSFFVDDGLIGDFAKEKIQSTIDWINSDETSNKERHKNIIGLVDEPILRAKMEEMYFKKFESEMTQDEKKSRLEEMAKQFGLRINFNDE